MDYKKLAADLLSSCEENCADCEYAGDSEFECTIAQLAATAITDLPARAEAAEARCETLEKMVKEYQDELIPGYRERAEKAERERDAAVSDIETILAYGNVNLDTCQYCRNGQCYARGGTKPCFPKWRGAKEE